MAQPKTPAMVLQELCTKKRFAPPTFEIIDSVMGTHINRFDYKVTVDRVIGIGTGSSKQISKHEAAIDALNQLEEIGLYDPKDMPYQEFKPETGQNKRTISRNTASIPSSPYKGTPNCIGPLKDLCFDNKIPEPVFKLINEHGPPHNKEFTYECQVATVKTIATSSTKKLAKQLAAQDMLEKVKAILPTLVAFCKDLPNSELPAITDNLDNIVLKRYNDTYGSVITNKTCQINDYTYTLPLIMRGHNLNPSDLADDFKTRDKEALDRILKKLEVDYVFLDMQEDPFMVALILKIDTPFTTIGMGDNKATADKAATDEAFSFMESFMGATIPEYLKMSS